MTPALLTLRNTRAVAGLQLRRRLRDRSALLQGIVAPILLAVIIASAFGGDQSVSAEVGVVDLDDGRLGAALEAESDEQVTITSVADLADARSAIEDRDLAAAIVIPDGFSASLAADPTSVDVLVDPGRQLQSDIAVAIATRLAAGVDATRIAVDTAVAADPALAGAPGVDALVADASTITAPVTLGASAFGEGFDPITYFAPSMAILFAFLTLGAGARTLIVERREGTLARLRSTPISDRAILIGVTGSVVLVGLVSFLTVWLITAIVFGADWGDPIGVLAVILATVVAVAGISTLVSGLARTEAQADGISSILAFGFALIGGGFLSPGDLPDALARIALITPNRWALDAFAELSAGAAGAAAVAPALFVLVGIGVVAGAIGLRVGRLDTA